MKRIAKLITTLFLGVVITMGVSANVKAEPVYRIEGPTVYLTSTEYPFISTKLDDGAFIPAGSLVFTLASSTVTSNALVPDSSVILGYGSTYRTIIPTAVKYTENAAPAISYEAPSWNPYFAWNNPYVWNACNPWTNPCYGCGYDWTACGWNPCGWNPCEWNPCEWNPCAWNACNAGCWWW